MRSSRARRSRVMWAGLVVALFPLMVVAAGGFRSDPLQAPYIDNAPHTVDANSDLWFKFDYGLYGPIRSLVTLSLVDGARSGIRFQVWAPENLGDWWQNQPTGVGSIATLDCTTGQPTATGQCLANDVNWFGAFGAVGTYYVHVVNDSPAPGSFLLAIAGMGVSLGAPDIAVPTATPIPAVYATPETLFVPGVTPVVVDDPSQAVPITGQPWIIPGNAVIWYKFDYSGYGLEPRLQVGLRLTNGMVTGVGYEVWSPQYVNSRWENKPAGRGTQEVLTNCIVPPDPGPTPDAYGAVPTVEPPTGKCPTNDLTWQGAFIGNGTYYVRVANPTSVPAAYTLTMYQRQ